MGNFVLKLTASGKEDVSLELSSSPPDAFIAPALGDTGADSERPYVFESDQVLFCDARYTMELCGQDVACVNGVDLFVNGERVELSYRAGRIEPVLAGGTLFGDCYGFVSLSLLADTQQGEVQLYTAYVPVLVKEGQQNDAVKAMISYVREHIDLFALPTKKQDVEPFGDEGRRNLEAVVSLAERIASVYEANWGYFKSNSRFCLKMIQTVESFDHLQFVEERTVRFIVSHPEQLKLSPSPAGVKVASCTYLPQKTLVEHRRKSCDIYENRVIALFLKTFLVDVERLHKRCVDLVASIPKQNDCAHTGYVYSPFYLFDDTKVRLEECRVRLERLKTRVEDLLWMYCDAFSFSKEQLSMPLEQVHPTALFLSLPQYNSIYECICHWRDFGSYDLSQEFLMLSFWKVSLLYESYLLAKLLVYFGECGFTRVSSWRFLYRMSKGAKYKNSSCKNTFVFAKDRCQITLYYQPVIFDGGKVIQNSIGLFKNNSFMLRAGYCTPDFILKVQSEDDTTYLLLDAKFSSADDVRTYQLKNLVFKYLFSISPLRQDSRVAGLCVLYGKTTSLGSGEQIQSMYDRQVKECSISPSFDLVPVAAGDEDKKSFPLLSRLVKQLMP